MTFEEYWKTVENITFAILITDDCNLKCNNCNFGCDQINICWYININEYKKILNIIKILYTHPLQNKTFEISILGGEVTQHPKLQELLEITVSELQNYSNYKLLITNGIDILNQNFQTINLYSKFYVDITKYPIKIDYSKIINFFKNTHIHTNVTNKVDNDTNVLQNIDDEDFTTRFYCRNLREKCDNSISKCNYGNRAKCLMFYKHKLFLCPNAVGFYQNEKLKEANKENNFKGDFIDIDSITCFDDILLYLKNNTICQYCHDDGYKIWSSKLFKNVRVN